MGTTALQGAHEAVKLENNNRRAVRDNCLCLKQ